MDGGTLALLSYLNPLISLTSGSINFDAHLRIVLGHDGEFCDVSDRQTAEGSPS